VLGFSFLDIYVIHCADNADICYIGMLGAKLCMLADTLGTTGSLTGVDVAKHRLAACRTMLQKYCLGDRTRLFVADGTLFSILPVNSRMRRMEGILILRNSFPFMFPCFRTRERKYHFFLVDTSACCLSQFQLALKKMEAHSQNGLQEDHGKIGRRLRKQMQMVHSTYWPLRNLN